MSPKNSNATVVTFDALYLGGLPEEPTPARRRRRLLLASTWGVGYGTGPDEGPIREWDEIASVGVEGGEIAKRKTVAILLFGVLGGLGGKAAKDRSYISVVTVDGAEGVWQVDRVTPMRARAALSPVLQDAGVAFTDWTARTVVSHSVSLADELEKLASLHERGLLSQEEFESGKRLLLAEPTGSEEAATDEWSDDLDPA